MSRRFIRDRDHLYYLSKEEGDSLFASFLPPRHVPMGRNCICYYYCWCPKHHRLLTNWWSLCVHLQIKSMSKLLWGPSTDPRCSVTIRDTSEFRRRPQLFIFSSSPQIRCHCLRHMKGSVSWHKNSQYSWFRVMLFGHTWRPSLAINGAAAINYPPSPLLLLVAFNLLLWVV